MVASTTNRRNCLEMSLCKLWQILFILTINGYLIYVTINDYLNLKKQILDRLYDRDNIQWSTTGPMNLQLSCLIFSLSLLPITILTLLIPTGNLANDSHILGQDIDNNQFLFDSDSKGRLIRIDSMFYTKSNSSLLNRKIRYQNKLIIQQFLPISIFLQILIALGYLIPLPFIEAQRIYEGILKPNALWHTNLDFLIDQDSGHPQFTNHHTWNYQQPLHPAYFYLLVTMATLQFRYPLVFWRTNRHFSLLFCASIFVFALQLVTDFSCLTILVKLAYNRPYLSAQFSPSRSPVTLAIVFCAASLVFLTMHVSLFNYGLNQYFLNLTKHRMDLRFKFKSSSHGNDRMCMETGMMLDTLKNHHDNVNEGDVNNNNNQDQDQDQEEMNINMQLSHNQQQDQEEEQEAAEEIEEEDDSYQGDRLCGSRCNERYTSVTMALVMGVVGAGLKCPLVLDCLTLYRQTGDKVMHLNLLVTGFVAIFWLITWFGLSLRDRWDFKVAVRSRDDNKSLQHQASTQLTHAITCHDINPSSHRIHLQENSLQRCLGGTSVYASCNQIVHTPLSRRSQQIGVGGPVTIEEDAVVGELANGYNYVLLHNGTPIYSTNGRVASPQNINPTTSSLRSNSNHNLQSIQNTAHHRPLQQKSLSPTNSEFGGANPLAAPTTTTILLSDDLLGSEKSFASSSILARSLTLQDKVHNNRHDSLSSSHLQTNEQILTSPNRYYKTVPASSLATNSYNSPQSTNIIGQAINQSGSNIRSPILSYQNSPTDRALSPIKMIGGASMEMNYQQNITNYSNKQQIELMEPDIISHRIMLNADTNNDASKSDNNKFIENEYDAVESSELMSNGDNGIATINSNNDNLTHKVISNDSNNLNPDFGEDEEGRLCSQV